MVVFYKKGVIYASKNKKIPQLADVYLIFFAIGIFTPLLLSCIPFLGFAALLVSIIAFLKTMPEILKIDNSAKIKPEKLAFIAIGLGIAGLIGFLLGFYRASSLKDEVENV